MVPKDFLRPKLPRYARERKEKRGGSVCVGVFNGSTTKSLTHCKLRFKANKGSKFEAEIKAEQEERKKEAAAAAERKAAFKAKMAGFNAD